MASTYVSIGRNIGGEPMGLAQWEDFRSAVYDAVAQYAGPVVTSAEGVGIYEGERETTYVVVGATYGGHHLWVTLQDLAREFEQDSIALTCGTTDFVRPR
jgi:hypothetical protein